MQCVKIWPSDCYKKRKPVSLQNDRKQIISTNGSSLSSDTGNVWFGNTVSGTLRPNPLVLSSPHRRKWFISVYLLVAYQRDSCLANAGAKKHELVKADATLTQTHTNQWRGGKKNTDTPLVKSGANVCYPKIIEGFAHCSALTDQVFLGDQLILHGRWYKQ